MESDFERKNGFLVSQNSFRKSLLFIFFLSPSLKLSLSLVSLSLFFLSLFLYHSCFSSSFFSSRLCVIISSSLPFVIFPTFVIHCDLKDHLYQCCSTSIFTFCLSCSLDQTVKVSPFLKVWALFVEKESFVVSRCIEP